MWLDAYILITTILYGVSVVGWLVHCYILPTLTSTRDQDLKAHDESDIQVRILTIKNESVVKRTASKASNIFSDVVVVAEAEMEKVDVQVHVVPEEFECEAVRKGRALEWARKNIETDKEYVLYIDEDTIIEEFDGIPDNDVVQFRESPSKTNSIISYLTEVYRTGYQTEQRGFSFYKYPLYAWGGGIAIRQSLEQEVTWNHETITEDTSFVWRAARIKLEKDEELTFSTRCTEFYNQAPTSILSLFQQRRRWVSGTLLDQSLLPFRYRLYTYIRLIFWCFSPFIFINGLLIYLYPTPIADTFGFIILVCLELLVLHFTSVVGIIQHQDESKLAYFALPLTGLLAFINSIGALWGVISPVSDFIVTKKQEIQEAVPILES